jgi:hypothetical protein
VARWLLPLREGHWTQGGQRAKRRTCDANCDAARVRAKKQQPAACAARPGGGGGCATRCGALRRGA